EVAGFLSEPTGEGEALLDQLSAESPPETIEPEPVAPAEPVIEQPDESVLLDLDDKKPDEPPTEAPAPPPVQADVDDDVLSGLTGDTSEEDRKS
ncbi:MAG: hypothetical protein AAF561_00865, partial [Planctomycetota bacterium]